LLLPVALTLAPAALLGCGGDVTEIESRTLRVQLTEYRLDPQDVRVKAGRLRLVAVNRGRLNHNVHVVRQDPDDRERSPEDLGGTQTTKPGESLGETITDLEPGEYRIVCTVANHDDLGMYGTLEAVDPEE
jgi:plastocyanin